MDTKEWNILKILFRANTMLLLIMLSSITSTMLKHTVEGNGHFLFDIVLVILILILHKILNNSMISLIRFNQIKKSVILRKANYIELTKGERALNFIFLAPISFLIGLSIFAVDNILIKLCMVPIILVFLIIGETANYRFKLYKEWYDQNLA